MATVSDETGSASRREQIMTVLGYYPHVNSDELAQLLHWFRKEATATDILQIASDSRLAKPYSKLKADHLDRLSGAELFRAAVMIMVIGAAIASLILWRIT